MHFQALIFGLLRRMRRAGAAIAAVMVAACSADSQPADVSAAAGSNAGLHVYKTPTCGCCSAWVEHVVRHGFDADVTNRDDLSELKASYGIPRRYQSCHTAVAEDGHVFEGHVPAKLVEQFLDQPPADAVGLAVPGMPVGSPGMEYQQQFMPYQVLLLKTDGSVEVYAELESAAEQY